MLVQKRIDIVFRAELPIAHHSETIGNHAHVMTRRVRLPGGSFAVVPEITGDTMRNRMRYEASIATLRAADMLDEHFSEGALRLLFSGGMVTGRGDASTISLDRYRELCDLVPPLSIFGGCADNRSIPGKMQVEPASVICAETERYFPEWVREWLEREGESLTEGRQHIEEVQRVRMDPLLNPSLRVHLLPGAKVEVNNRLAASEAAHQADEPVRDADKSTMMPRTFERLIQGTLFLWRCTVTCHSALELDTFFTVIASLLQAGPRVGGKQGTGHGLLRAVAARGVEVKREVERAEALDVADPAARIGELFERHVAERKERIRDFFRTVNA